MSRLYRFAKSLKLGVVLILLLAIGSIGAVVVGQWIPPGMPLDDVAGLYGSGVAGWAERFQLNHPYSSWWFLTLLTCLSVNLTLCTIDRWPNTVGWLQRKSCPREAAFFEKDDCQRVELRVGDTSCREALLRVLAQKGYRVAQAEQGEIHSLVAEKCVWGRLGSLVTHIGLLALLLGGIASALSGSRQLAMLGVGEQVPIPGTLETLRLNDFRIEETETGQVSDYLSSLSVLAGETVVAQKTIEVNHPLEYGGLTFYQSSYGEEPRIFERATVRLQFSDDDRPAEDLVLIPQQAQPIGGQPYSIEAIDFVTDFKVDASGAVYSASAQPRNPAIKLRFSAETDTISEGWFFMHHPDFGGTEIEGVGAQFMGYRPRYRSGIELVSNPGAPAIWIGFAIASVGLLSAFTTNHRTLWFAISPTRKGTATIRWRGRWQKCRYRMAPEVEQLLQTITK